MVEALKRVSTPAANPREFISGDLSQRTVVSDEYRDVAFVQADRTTFFGAGFGPNDDSTNSDGWSDLDVVASGNGALTGGDPINGRLRFVVYNDSDRGDPIARSGTYTLSSLRSAVSSDRKDKALIPGLLSTVAPPDGYVALQIQADGASDGAEIDPAASAEELGIAYSSLNRSDL
jgi:hypothetical protein